MKASNHLRTLGVTGVLLWGSAFTTVSRANKDCARLVSGIVKSDSDVERSPSSTWPPIAYVLNEGTRRSGAGIVSNQWINKKTLDEFLSKTAGGLKMPGVDFREALRRGLGGRWNERIPPAALEVTMSAREELTAEIVADALSDGLPFQTTTPPSSKAVKVAVTNAWPGWATSTDRR